MGASSESPERKLRAFSIALTPGDIPRALRCPESESMVEKRGDVRYNYLIDTLLIEVVVSMRDSIFIKGARENNLKNIDLEIPRDKLVVFTGLSGSGKSSLAFDTIYAEGQRRYVESLSSYARMFLGQMDKPDVDYIEGLSPAISHRPEDHEPQPALHRGHGDGDI